MCIPDHHCHMWVHAIHPHLCTMDNTTAMMLLADRSPSYFSIFLKSSQRKRAAYAKFPSPQQICDKRKQRSMWKRWVRWGKLGGGGSQGAKVTTWAIRQTRTNQFICYFLTFSSRTSWDDGGGSRGLWTWVWISMPIGGYTWTWRFGCTTTKKIGFSNSYAWMQQTVIACSVLVRIHCVNYNSSLIKQ